MLLWLEFLICSALIVFSGFKLSRDSEKRSIGRAEYQPQPKSICETIDEGLP